MTTLAALHHPSTAAPVLDIAHMFAALSGAAVTAVNVADAGDDELDRLTSARGIGLTVLAPPVVAALLRAIDDPTTTAAVLGSSQAVRGGPLGPALGGVLEHSSKPIFVTPLPGPPETTRPLRRALVPLDGTTISSEPLRDGLQALLGSDVELDVLHVFTEDTVPRVLDRPGRDLALLGDEFVARHYPQATRIDLRAGHVGDCVRDLCTEHDIDLVVLSWMQQPGPGRAAVLRDVIAHSQVPVLVLPASAPHGDTEGPTRQRTR